MFAITVFPKRLGLVIQICEFPVSAGKNNSSSIKLLSTKYGFLTSLSYKEYGAALFKKIPIFRLLCLFLFYYQCTMASCYLQEKPGIFPRLSVAKLLFMKYLFPKLELPKLHYCFQKHLNHQPK